MASSKMAAASLANLSKIERRNQAKVKRDEKRKKRLNAKRADIPRIVGIVNLTDAPSRMVACLCETADDVETKSMHQFTAQFRTNKITFLSASTVSEAMDMVRVCDILVLEVDGNHEGAGPSNMVIGASSAESTATGSSKFDVLISESANDILQALKAQGLPTPLTVLTYEPPMMMDPHDDAMTMQSAKSSRRFELHRHQGLRKYIQRLSTTEFGDKAKVVEWNPANETTVQNLIRTITTMSCRPASWIADSPRSYLLVEEVSGTDDCCLEVSGYVRGGVLDIHSLFHIPHVGTFAARSAKRGVDIVVADPTLRESLDRYATPNALDGEQNLIGFDGEGEQDDDTEMKQEIQRPAGWSSYQNAWLDAIDGDETEDNDVDHGEMADELNTKHSQITDDMMDDDDDVENLAAAKAAMDQERRKQYKEDAQFPDEVQVPDDTNARDRFQRYRALKNFRKSTWDPKENLPDSFANIFHLKNFAQTQKVVMKDLKEVEKAAEAVGNKFFGSTHTDEMKDAQDDDDILEGCIPCGTYVTICLENVTEADMKRMPKTSTMAVVSLLPHENKVSVLNIGLKHCNPGCEPIKSKDVLTFRCGWRSWNARPVFSQHNLNSDKHKLERFLPDQNAHICASVFGPVTYTPCPVLAFRGNELVAIGSMLGANADRIVVKRILLTGYPVKVRKRMAVVKYMFYNPEDVKWFKPAGLYTKHGLSGHITQSVGEHGTMKCLFNAPIHQHDTVCLPLYKRIFPKYAPTNDGSATALEIL